MSGFVTGRTRYMTAAVVISLIAAVVLSYVVSCDQPAARQSSAALVLLYGNDVEGILTSCGCPGKPMGGLAKRETAIAACRRGNPDAILVDSGGYLRGRVAKEKVPYVMKAMAGTGYDAVAVDEGLLERLVRKEWALAEMTAEGRVPLVCSNLDVPEVPTERIVERGGWRIGIFQVFSENPMLWERLHWPRVYRIKSPEDVAKAVVARLRQEKRCDLVIALTRQTVAADRQLAQKVPGIDVIVGGADGVLLREPLKEGATTIVQAGAGGSYLGVLRLKLADGHIVETNNEFVALTSQIPDDERISKLYTQYLKESGSKEVAPEDNYRITFFKTAESCQACHPEQYKVWLGMKHADALKTIDYAKRDGDPECKYCHTMGLGRPGGFRSRSETPELARVTCQACHLPGKTKLEGRELECQDKVKVKVEEATCRACHTAVTSPRFDFGTYQAKINHSPSLPAKKNEAPSSGRLSDRVLN